MTRPKRQPTRPGPYSIDTPESLRVLTAAEREHIIWRRAGGRSGEGRTYRDDRTGAVVTPLVQHLIRHGLLYEVEGPRPYNTVEPTAAGLAHLRLHLAPGIVAALFTVLGGGLPARARTLELIG